MLATIVLILFVAFSLQTRHSPYMSASQRQIVLAEHAIKAESGDRMHYQIRESIKKIKAIAEHGKKSKSGRTKLKRSFSKLTVLSDEKMTDRKKVITFFFDYNTVELALLFCAVLVCLAGVMFESDRFKATDGAGSLRYSWQRDLVTYIVIFIVFSSFVYLAIVMLNEITGYTPKCLKSTSFCKKNKENAMMSAANTIQNQRDDQIEMSMLNPAMVES